MSEAALKRIRGDSPLEAHKLEQVGILTSLDCYLISSNHDNYYLSKGYLISSKFSRGFMVL